ncbi:hypothetical protein ACFWY9_18390 [Amycolatopsis sp. NPDC059027]|uniref:hypothetical protein n=1 Tax=unclassified Amycolatopsis TaxID=2618356 RepID=UPI00366E0FF5
MVALPSGALPAGTTSIPCDNAMGKPGSIKIFTEHTQVLLIAPPGETAQLTAQTARTVAHALMRHAGHADGVTWRTSRGNRSAHQNAKES